MRKFGLGFLSCLELRSTLSSISKYWLLIISIQNKVENDTEVFLLLPLFSQASSFGWFWSGYLASIGDTFSYNVFHVSINHWRLPFRYNLLRKKFPATSFTGSPVLSDAGFDLLNSLLTYDPDKVIIGPL